MDGQAFGKVILFGEHAVVHGIPALAAALDRGVRASAKPGRPSLMLHAAAGSAPMVPPEDSDVGRAFAEILRVTGQSAQVAVWFDVPVQVGLGSSAAFCVAVARALGASEAQVREAGLAGETIFHGRPSGIDLEVVQRGGVGRFSRAEGWSELSIVPFELCVGLSGQHRATRTRVAQVTKLLESFPETGGRLLSGVSAVVDRAEVALREGDLASLGALMDVNHGLLCAMGVSTLELDKMCHVARGAGALGAKLTGAGGGGAVLALAPGAEADVLASWKSAGFEGFRARVPCGR